MNQTEALEALARLINLHDMTYESSDDSWYYNRGRKQAEEINKFVADNAIDYDEFVKIWNRYVDKKIAQDWRSEYYKTPKEPLQGS